MKVKFISKLLCIGALVFAQFGTVNAQSFGVHGRVSDSKGEAVVGASVFAGQNNWTTTDENGQYAIDGVEKDAVLTVSCLGYVEQKINVASRSVIDIVLNEENSLLEETVVIGYGKMKKSDLTGSVSSVNPEKLVVSPANSVETEAI